MTLLSSVHESALYLSLLSLSRFGFLSATAQSEILANPAQQQSAQTTTTKKITAKKSFCQ